MSVFVGAMSQREAGLKADATIVVNLVRDQFTNPAKDAIRAWVIAELKAAEPTLVLDLWGGGRSAEEMTAAGLSVLSVEDGRAFEGLGVSKARIRRALEMKAEAGGYRAAWGPARRFAPECDAAWLDFMGHLSGETVRTLEVCRGLKLVAITLMPDRMAGVANLPVKTWLAMYRAAITEHSGMSVRQWKTYRREGGLWAIVMIARRTPWRLNSAARSTPEYRETRREYVRNRRRDPATRDLILAREKTSRALHPRQATEERRRRDAERARAKREAAAIARGPVIPKKGEEVASSKLTEGQVLEIRRRYATNGGRGSQTALAREYGVSQENIGLIVNRRSWTHLP